MQTTTCKLFSLILLFVSAIFARSVHAQGTPADLLKENLAVLKNIYESEYAPREWKKTYAQWTVDSAYQSALAAVTAHAEQLKQNSPQAQNVVKEIIKQFIYSTKDYHVSVRFFSTESATLPFSVRSAEGRVFIAYIDRDKLPVMSFPFDVGDELLQFEGKPITEALAAVQAQIPANIPETDRALAEMALTSRRASSGYTVPHGPVNVTVMPQGDTVAHTVQLQWNDTPEAVHYFPIQDVKHLNLGGGDVAHLPSLNMLAYGSDQDRVYLKASNPFALGARKSFVPPLGPKLWQTDDSNTFDAYLYKTEDRKLIGVVRIPEYHLDDEDYPKAVLDFAKIIDYFQDNADALVIDQVNNPGGSVPYLYMLASMLAAEPLQTPKHRMSLVQADVQEAIENLNALNAVTDDATAKKVLGSNWNGYLVSYQLALFQRNSSRFIIDQWNAGKRLTDPYYIAGVDRINPNPAFNFTKPILVLVNELCFSGGDFFPAILQDNHRATVMGVRTAGAGGYVHDVSFPNLLGISSVRVTESIAERVDLNPIENLGVKPDVEYTLKVSDLQNHFASYRQAIRAAVEGMVKAP